MLRTGPFLPLCTSPVRWFGFWVIKLVQQCDFSVFRNGWKTWRRLEFRGTSKPKKCCETWDRVSSKFASFKTKNEKCPQSGLVEINNGPNWTNWSSPDFLALSVHVFDAIMRTSGAQKNVTVFNAIDLFWSWSVVLQTRGCEMTRIRTFLDPFDFYRQFFGRIYRKQNEPRSNDDLRFSSFLLFFRFKFHFPVCQAMILLRNSHPNRKLNCAIPTCYLRKHFLLISLFVWGCSVLRLLSSAGWDSVEWESGSY